MRGTPQMGVFQQPVRALRIIRSVLSYPIGKPDKTQKEFGKSLFLISDFLLRKGDRV